MFYPAILNILTETGQIIKYKDENEQRKFFNE